MKLARRACRRRRSRRRRTTSRAQPTPRRSTARQASASTSDPVARAIVPPAGRITGSGPALAVNPAENNAFKAINRAWKAGADACAFERGRYVITGLSPSAQSDARRTPSRSTPSASRATAGDAAAAAHRRCSSPTPAWTKAGRAGCWSSTSSSTRACPARTSRPAALRDKIDVLLITDEPQGAAAGRRRARRRGARRRWRGASAGSDADNDARAARDRGVRPRRRHARLLQPQQHLRDRSSQAAGEERRRRAQPPEFFVGGSLLNVVVDPAPSRDGRHARARGRVLRQRPGVRDRWKASTARCSRAIRTRDVLASGFLQGEKCSRARPPRST